MTVCPSCGRVVDDHHSTCPHCGVATGKTPAAEAMGVTPLQEYAVPVGGPAQGPYSPPYPGPYGQPYPQTYPYHYSQPYPYPYPYHPYAGPPLTGVRIAAVAGGVLMLIDGILAFILGLPVLFFMGSPAGAFLLTAFILSMVGATAVFRCESVHLAIVGCLALVAAGVAVMFAENDFIILGLIGIAIAVISLGLVWVGWQDMRARERWRKEARDGQPVVAPPPVAYPVVAQPPPYDPGQSQDGPRMPR